MIACLECLSGFATPEGTATFARNATENNVDSPVLASHFQPLSVAAPSTESILWQGLSLSGLGIGTYLGQADEETNLLVSQAVIASVESGAINVIDTAINYRYQLAERSVGEALHALSKKGYSREQIFVSTKNGYLSPDADQPVDMKTWFDATFFTPGLMTPDDIAGGIHCMHPAFLENQLNQSLSNLSIDTIDLMYLHNAAESQLETTGRTLFMERLRQAFTFYEQARNTGKIRYYGMATWDCFRCDPAEATRYLSLESVVSLARAIGGENHGFRAIQLPFNRAFSEAATLKNQLLGSQHVTLLEAAEALGIGVFTSVPLLQKQLLQPQGLPSYPGLESLSQRCLQQVRSTPGILCPLVGHKHPSHVADNIQVSRVPRQQVAHAAY
ncbi:MAG: aldo/keto reductase [Cyanobacteria bacterium]|nr:aldo/keto reductase [Cyanobacteriota bacterium]